MVTKTIFILWVMAYSPYWEQIGSSDMDHTQCTAQALTYMEAQSYGKDAWYLCLPKSENPN